MACFYGIIFRNLTVFNTLTLQQIFWITKTFFKKLEYRFLNERKRIENASFPYKTAMSEPTVKVNRMRSTKWTNHKERSFAGNYFIFLKLFCFSLRTSYKELIWCTNYLNVNIHTFRERWSFISFFYTFFPSIIFNHTTI